MGRRNDTPYFDTRLGIPWDEMILAVKIAEGGASDQRWFKIVKTPKSKREWVWLEFQIKDFFDNGYMRRASNILRRGWHYRER